VYDDYFDEPIFEAQIQHTVLPLLATSLDDAPTVLHSPPLAARVVLTAAPYSLALGESLLRTPLRSSGSEVAATIPAPAVEPNGQLLRASNDELPQRSEDTAIRAEQQHSKIVRLDAFDTREDGHIDAGEVQPGRAGETFLKSSQPSGIAPHASSIARALSPVDIAVAAVAARPPSPPALAAVTLRPRFLNSSKQVSPKNQPPREKTVRRSIGHAVGRGDLSVHQPLMRVLVRFCSFKQGAR
jgi:hypothetical protein